PEPPRPIYGMRKLAFIGVLGLFVASLLSMLWLTDKSDYSEMPPEAQTLFWVAAMAFVVLVFSFPGQSPNWQRRQVNLSRILWGWDWAALAAAIALWCAIMIGAAAWL